MASMTFKKMMGKRRELKRAAVGLIKGARRMTKLKRVARRRLLVGPAREMRAASLLGFSRL